LGKLTDFNRFEIEYPSLNPWISEKNNPGTDTIQIDLMRQFKGKTKPIDNITEMGWLFDLIIFCLLNSIKTILQGKRSENPIE
jgi:hypothetical protein